VAAGSSWLSGIEAIGVDEIQWHNGHTYLTLVYQIDGANATSGVTVAPAATTFFLCDLLGWL